VAGQVIHRRTKLRAHSNDPARSGKIAGDLVIHWQLQVCVAVN
jgi:hypothetical protein